jgi:hypothetical protein
MNATRKELSPHQVWVAHMENILAAGGTIIFKLHHIVS